MKFTAKFLQPLEPIPDAFSLHRIYDVFRSLMDA